jgi:hypothetical protein
MVLGGRDQEERPIRSSIDTCPAGGTRRLFPGDLCRLCNTSGQPCPAGLLLCQLAFLQTDGAAWCAG